MQKRVLIAGISTRAAAESAARAGFEVTAIDRFADLDQHPSVRALSLPTTFTPAAAANAARDIDCDAVAYLSNFENHPRAVSTLAAGRVLWGNSPKTLGRVRDPILVARLLRERGFAAPECLTANGGTPNLEPRDWLVKPLASGGGHRIHRQSPDTRVPADCYLQEVVEGTPGSVVFVAAGGRAVPLGMSRQLIGEHAFGVSGYKYCGSILATAGDAQFANDAALVDSACALAAAVAETFGLVGVNGLDFVAQDGVPYAIEINPRWCASMELVERAYGASVFSAHAGACATSALPAFDLAHARRDAAVAGKAVVFARNGVTIGDTRAWLDPRAQIRDVPRPGQRILAGHPVCTVFATARDGDACHAALVEGAGRIYAQLTGFERSVS